jgi:ribosomal protein L11 methyltransferase
VSEVWRLTADVRGGEAASAVFAILDDAAGAVSAFESGAEEWRLEAYPRSPALSPRLRVQLALATAAAGGVLVEIVEERLAARDWLAENQLAFPPQRVGRFFIYGSHFRGTVPPGKIGIVVDAATAFGTGEHASTRGCLTALERLARQRRPFRLLDVGTGTGILSIAAAKLLRRNVLAGDIDQDAVGVARHNVARNGVAGLVRARRANGYKDRAFRKGSFDLIFANILARPLAIMAPDLARALAPGGRAVLSGLLRRQEPAVLAPHRGRRIVLEQRIVIDGWSTLVMRRAGSALRPPYGGEHPLWESGSAGRTRPACSRPRSGLRFATGESRYRTGNDHRAPSAGHKPGPGAATRKTIFRRIGEG